MTINRSLRYSVTEEIEEQDIVWSSTSRAKNCTSILMFMIKLWKTPKKLKKSMSIFPSYDQCLSLENICQFSYPAFIAWEWHGSVDIFKSIESHFVGVHGPYELHRKEEQIKCTAFFYIFLQQSLSRYCLLLHKMSYLSDFKSTKSKTLRTASSWRLTNWTNPPCDPVQIIRTKDWYL